MRAINRKAMRTDKFLSQAMRAYRHFRKAAPATIGLSSFLGLALLLAGSFGCAPDSSPGDGKQNQSTSAPKDLPEITEETLREEINDAYVREVPEENGAGEPISWGFDENEPKEYTVLERQIEGERATIIIDIKTSSAPGARTPRYLTGKIRTKWELQTGWALRTWEIVETENISIKYKNLPKPPAQNSNR